MSLFFQGFLKSVSRFFAYILFVVFLVTRKGRGGRRFEPAPPTSVVSSASGFMGVAWQVAIKLVSPAWGGVCVLLNCTAPPNLAEFPGFIANAIYATPPHFLYYRHVLQCLWVWALT